MTDSISRREIFRLNGSYVAGPDVTPQQLRDDAFCWLDQAKAIVSHLAAYSAEHEDNDNIITSLEMQGMLFGAHNLMELAYNAFLAGKCEMVKPDPNGN